MSTSMPHETTIEIPCRDLMLVGTLAQADPATKSDGLALILHGQMAHQHQLYHKPLVRTLVSQRSMDSFRFDFVHAKYNQPGWVWHMAQIERDVEELQCVVDHLKTVLGYKIRYLIAHSKGSLASFKFLSQTSDPPPFYVNLSGRYDMQRAHEIMGPRYYPAFKEHGYYEWKAKVAGQHIAVKVTPEQFEEFKSWDTSFVKDRFPLTTSVLTIHGDADAVVPIDDGKTYHSILSSRPGPGTSSLYVLKDGDHNFIGRFDEVVNTIMAWLDEVDPRPNKPGKGKL